MSDGSSGSPNALNRALDDLKVSPASHSPSKSGSSKELTNPSTPTTNNGVTDNRFVIAIDFGTTYSGVAVVYSAAPDEIEVIKTWPGGNGITSDKVPTELSYRPALNIIRKPSPSPSSKSSRSESNTYQISDSTKCRSTSSLGLSSSPLPQFRWGFQFKPEESRLRCIKLFLDRSQTLPSFVSPLETASMLREAGKNVLESVSDYLSALHAHTMDTLTRRYGESFMASTPVDFVLTTPAVWSDAAKHATLCAAQKAGLGVGSSGIRLISEPEAAAVYTLKAVQPNPLKVGDNVVVCDAGGGTADLISYKVVQTQPSLLVEESNVGSGGLCGAAFLNFGFEDYCRNRLGPEVYDNMKPRAKTLGLKTWDEYVKRNFKGDDEDEEFAIPFPGLPDDLEAGIEDGFMTLRGSEVKAIFEPVIQEVTRLCENQVEGIWKSGDRVSGIVLVGGFGQNNYLYNRLKDHFNNVEPLPYSERPTGSSGGSIEIMQPLHAWTAVVRGAALRGLEGNMVQHRKARCHYGTSYATVYDEMKHPEEEKYWSPLWERWMVSNRMQWHITRGQQISEQHPISFHYTRNFRPNQSLVVEDDLISCDLDEAPESLDREKVVTVCTLTTDLGAVPKSLFTRLTTTKGVLFDNLDFCLDMIIDSNLRFELKVGGVAYGSVNAKFH